MKEERSCTLGSPLTSGEINLDGGGASEESTATGLWKARWRVTCTDGQYHRPAPRSLRHLSASVGRVWVLKLGLWRSDSGRGLGLAALRQPEEAGVWKLRVHSEEAWAL